MRVAVDAVDVSLHEEDIVALLFAGCGWMHPFEFGVAAWLHEHFDCSSTFLRFGGTSAGSSIASGLALGIDMEVFFEETLTLYEPCKYLPFAMCDGVKKVRSSWLADAQFSHAVAAFPQMQLI